MPRILALILTTIGAFGTVTFAVVLIIMLQPIQSGQFVQSVSVYQKINAAIVQFILGGLVLFSVLIFITGVIELRNKNKLSKQG